jgi:phenylacetate-coenzyme A ligase PaaK-like adenylate-forming protein
VSDAYTALASRVLFPIFERIKGHDTLRVRKELERTQWLDAERLRALQTARLRDLLVAAGRTVPYYGRLFKRLSFRPTEVGAIGDLARLPLLTKADVRANGDALRSSEARSLAPFSTGGSSGEPLRFLLGKERVSHDVAAKWRATRWWGVDIGDREIVLWGSPIELGAQDRLREIRDGLLRSRLLPAFEMSETTMDRYAQVVLRMRPRMLFGYPSALARLAAHAERRGIELGSAGVSVAFVTAERLDAETRERIERGFACRVANGYGGRDAGFLAHECPQGGMHITAEDVVLEIVDAAGAPCPNGVSGEVVVTHLASRDFPFIRYATGDLAVLDDGRCACGRGLPLVRDIQGRTTDFVMGVDGNTMHALALIYVVRELVGIERFKIIQETRTHTRVLVVPGPGFGPDIARSIESGIGRRLGPGVRVEVEPVADIPAERSGKFRQVVSRITEGRKPDPAAP